MKKSNGDVIREKYLQTISKMFKDEQTMRISTGSICFPVVAEDGEEGWVEIAVKIPKWTDDDDGFAKSEEYALALADKAEKKKLADAEKARKTAEREAKKKKKENAE